MKMHMKDLYKDIISKVNLVKSDVKDGDFAKANAGLNEQLDNLNKEGHKMQEYLPEIEVLEKELEMLDASGHDDELAGLSAHISQLVETTKKELKEKGKAQKK